MQPSIRHLEEEAGGTHIAYGPPEHGVAVVDSYGPFQAEYAAMRKGAGLLHLPQRGLLRLRGSDRLDFLHRFLTHDTRTLQPGQGRRAFLLGRTGRIIADMIVLEQQDQTLVDLDVFDADDVHKQLEGFLFSEDVQIENLSESSVHLAIHGPAAIQLLAAVATHHEAAASLPQLGNCDVAMGGHAVHVFRRDDAGSLGLHLLCPAQGAVAVYAALAEPLGGMVPDVEGGVRRPVTGRAIGWLAYNTARIEAGTPLFHIDFGPDSLPHETGVLDETVSFTKGCYVGQEVVARMQHLGHPKRIIVGLKFPDDRLPTAGTPVYAPPKESVAPTDAKATVPQVIGGVTSSTISPMLGGTAIALATVKWAYHEHGTRLLVPAEGGNVEAEVTALRFI